MFMNILSVSRPACIRITTTGATEQSVDTILDSVGLFTLHYSPFGFVLNKHVRDHLVQWLSAEPLESGGLKQNWYPLHLHLFIALHLWNIASLVCAQRGKGLWKCSNGCNFSLCPFIELYYTDWTVLLRACLLRCSGQNTGVYNLICSLIRAYFKGPLCRLKVNGSGFGLLHLGPTNTHEVYEECIHNRKFSHR